MGEQLADGDVLFAVFRELGQVGSYEIVEAQLSFLNQPHDRRSSGDAFGDGSNVKDRVQGHGFSGGLQRTGPESLAVDHLGVVSDENDAARNRSLRDRRVHDAIDRGESGAGSIGRILGNQVAGNDGGDQQDKNESDHRQAVQNISSIQHFPAICIKLCCAGMSGKYRLPLMNKELFRAVRQVANYYGCYGFPDAQ